MIKMLVPACQFALWPELGSDTFLSVDRIEKKKYHPYRNCWTGIVTIAKREWLAVKIFSFWTIVCPMDVSKDIAELYSEYTNE